MTATVEVKVKEVSVFDRYPDGLFDRRYESCWEPCLRRFMRDTGQTQCAYCGISLFAQYDIWEIWELDHVIPKELSENLGIPDLWYHDMANIVPACRTCNKFDYVPSFPVSRPETVADFLALRNRIFEDRKPRILAKRRDKKTAVA